MDLLGPIFVHKPFVDNSPLIPSCIKYGRRFKLVFGKKAWFCVAIVAERTLVTQAKLQLKPHCTKLRSMDLFNQILCRFQKYKGKVPPPSLPFGRKKKRRLKVQFMEVNFFFQESFFSVIQAKVVQFFTYWNQNFFFRKDQKKYFWNYFFESSCTRRVHEGSKKLFWKYFFWSFRKKFFGSNM